MCKKYKKAKKCTKKGKNCKLDNLSNFDDLCKKWKNMQIFQQQKVQKAE